MKNIKAFTIVETLIAIGILMAAIAGPIAISQKSLKSGLIAKDNLTAVYLAQEGMEIVKAKINYNIFNGLDWKSGLDDGTYPAIRTEGFDFSASDPTAANYFLPASCPVSVRSGEDDILDCFLTYDGANNYYAYKPTNDPSGQVVVSPYIRNMDIVEVVAGQEILVTISVAQKTNSNVVEYYSLKRHFYKF